MVHGGVCALTVGRSTIDKLIEIVRIKAIKVFMVLVDNCFTFRFLLKLAKGLLHKHVFKTYMKNLNKISGNKELAADCGYKHELANDFFSPKVLPKKY